MIVAGVKGLDIGGTSYATEDSAKYSTSDREYSEVTGGSGFLGVEGKGAAPYIEVTVRLAEGQSLDDLRIKGETVILRCEDRTVTLSKGYYVGKAENQADKNSVSCRFAGTKCTEVF